MFTFGEKFVPSSEIDSLYDSGFSKNSSDLEPGFYALKSETNQSALVHCKGDYLDLIDGKSLTFQGVKPRDSKQTCMMFSMANYPLTVAMGAAGTGKTTLACAFALHSHFKKDNNIVLLKPTSFTTKMSNAIAPIPGDHREKMAGYIDSYLFAMNKILGENFEHYLFQLEEEKKLVYQPLELVRGMNFEKSTIIIDEAQNTTPHELLTVISRVADTSKIIVMGDLQQIDIGLAPEETGLGCLLDSDFFWDSPHCGAIELDSQYRGPLAELAGEILKEIYASREDLEAI